MVIGASSFSSATDREATEEAASRDVLPLVDGAPVSSLQIRLSDGQKVVVKVNPSHTLEQIRAYICR